MEIIIKTSVIAEINMEIINCNKRNIKENSNGIKKISPKILPDFDRRRLLLV